MISEGNGTVTECLEENESQSLKERNLLSVETIYCKIMNPEVEGQSQRGVGTWRNEHQSFGALVPSRGSDQAQGEMRTTGPMLLLGSWIFLVLD